MSQLRGFWDDVVGTGEQIVGDAQQSATPTQEEATQGLIETHEEATPEVSAGNQWAAETYQQGNQQGTVAYEQAPQQEAESGVLEVYEEVTQKVSEIYDEAKQGVLEGYEDLKDKAAQIYAEAGAESDSGDEEQPAPEEQPAQPSEGSDVVILPAVAVVALLAAVHQAGRKYFEDQMKPVPLTKITDKDLVRPADACSDARLNAARAAVDNEFVKVDALIDKATSNVWRIPYAYLTGLLTFGMIGLLGTKTPVAALVTAGIGGVAGALAAMADAHRDVLATNAAIATYNSRVDELQAAFNEYIACRTGLAPA
jgi:hypothetical protein